jgi:hypothetical protein
MKRKIIVGSLALFLGIASCIKHEIIPPPEPKVTLKANFKGIINGTDTELTENVAGYFLDANKAKIILPAPALSSAVYYSEMKSTASLRSIRISFGSLQWSSSVSDDPTKELFDGFMNARADVDFPHVYSNNGTNGFEVMFTDVSGVVWRSKEDSGNPQSVVLSNLQLESDNSGDYAKFMVEFSCTVYHTFLEGQIDPDTGLVLEFDTEKSFEINNAVFKTWFKR